jgi:hypothetical protein
MCVLWSCLALGCGPDQVTAGDGETGADETGADDEAPAAAHWLIYDVSDLPEIELRAVDVSQIAGGVIGPPVVLLESDEDHYQDWRNGPTPWGGYAFALDDEYMLIGLDLNGQIEVYRGVPEGVPAKVHHPRFSADGSIALFAGEPTLPPDAFYWVRYEHGHPVDGGPLGQMTSELSSGGHWVSPDGSYGVVVHREGAGVDRTYQFPLDPEPGLAQPLFDDGEERGVVEVFDHHLFVWNAGGLHMPFGLAVVDMSSGIPGEEIPITPANVGFSMWFSASGDTVVWLESEDPFEGEVYSALWRVDLVDGVPQPAVELTGPDEVVHPDWVHLRTGTRRVAWQSNALHWVDFVGDQLGPIHTIDDADSFSVSWSPDQRFVSWVGSSDGFRGISALGGPEAGALHYVEQHDADRSAAWLDDRMLYSTGAGTQLWSVGLTDTGLGASSPLDPPSLESAHGRQATGRIVGHDVAVLEVMPAPESPSHVQLLRWDMNGSPEALPIDEAPRSQVVHQIVRN